MVEISNCKLNSLNNLEENNKLVVVQIGTYLFSLGYLRRVTPEELPKTIEKYNLVLLRE